MSKVNILFLSLGPVFSGFSDNSPSRKKYIQISEWATGTYTHTIYSKDISIPEEAGFRFHGVFLPKCVRQFSLFKIAWFTASVISHAYSQKRQQNSYNIVVAREPLVSGPIAILVAKIGGAKAIIEFNGNYKKAWDFIPGKNELFKKLRLMYAHLVVPLVLKGASAVKLLYPSQIDGWNRNAKMRIFVFHDFVPISIFAKSEFSRRRGREILFIGFPWYLKGVDLLAEAYKKICKDYEDVSLRVVCSMDDAGYQQVTNILKGCENVIVQRGVHYDEVPELMGGCSIFVLPSRTEAMGRVLLEAMAMRKPIIAANVDGIPFYITDGTTGLLFEGGNAMALERSLRCFLDDYEYATKIGEKGYLRLQQDLSEERFSSEYRAMVEEVLGADI